MVGAQDAAANLDNTLTIAIALGQVVAAIAAVIIAAFTVMLARFTRRYVAEMQEANALQAQANEIQQGYLGLQREFMGASASQEARARQLQAPVIAWSKRGSNMSSGSVSAKFHLKNMGATAAQGLVVFTTLGESTPMGLEANGETTIELKGPQDGIEGDQDLKVLRFVFYDPAGTKWVQESGGIPYESTD